MRETGANLIEKILFFYYFIIKIDELNIKTDELNVDNSNQMYLENTNILLDIYAPLKKN